MWRLWRSLATERCDLVYARERVVMILQSNDLRRAFSCCYDRPTTAVEEVEPKQLLQSFATRVKEKLHIRETLPSLSTIILGKVVQS